MANVVEAFGQAALAGILQNDRAGGRVEPAGQEVEEGGFSGAVAPGDHQGLAGLEIKGDALEDAALPPLAGQILNTKTQTVGPLP